VHARDEEVVLSGGRLTAAVVRVGETVRRPSKSCSQFVARLLRHLEAVGFEAAPRYLGSDAEGRDVFDYIAGTVHPNWQQWTDEQVAAAGRLLRMLHDATAGSALAAGKEVVCHNDAGPNNVVFREGLPVALIDFDFAAPGAALDDLAYMAWAWCISSKRGEPVASQAAQVRLLADAYGLGSARRTSLVEAIVGALSRTSAGGATASPILLSGALPPTQVR
jgi:Ser/Thr protein kinase RdoA (MazF antagonist)